MPKAFIYKFINNNPNRKIDKMANSIKAIWCDNVAVPSIEEGKRVAYKFISGGRYVTGFEWSEVSSFVVTGDQADFTRAVESCLVQADDHHHVFIEGFDFNETNKTWEVCLGS